MKTLEITTPSGTYLALDLPEDARDIKHSPIGNWIHFLHEIEDKGFGLYLGTPVLHELPDGNWQLIGFGKDHPKLVEELGLLQDNLKPVYSPMNGEPIINSIKRYNKQQLEWEQAESKVFKNPAILRKND